MIGIIDYGAGNPVSVMNILRHMGIGAFISGEPEELAGADKLVLPGTGAFGAAINKLTDTGIAAMLNSEVIQGGKPLLGICLGMQLMTISSEEAHMGGLGWFNAKTKLLEVNNKELKVPHVGWSSVLVKKNSRLFDGQTQAKFYFSHSYHVVCADNSDVLCTTDHGVTFVSGMERDNIACVQFHPEKSGVSGMVLLRNFANKF